MKTPDSANMTKARQGSGCCCGNKSAAVISTQASGLPVQHVQVENATCGGCATSIEQALQSVSGVVDARMDLTRGIASVTGTAQPRDLVKALEREGFLAAAVN